MQIEVYRDADVIVIDGTIAVDIENLGDGIYAYTPNPPHWQLWHEDKQAMRNAGFKPHKTAHGTWAGTWDSKVYEANK